MEYAVKSLLLASSLLLVLTIACAAPAPTGVGTAEEVKTRVDQGGANFQCDAGKEHWRSPGPPKRGGILVRSGTSYANLDPASTRPRTGAPSQVYQALFQPRSCFFGDTTVVPILARGWDVSSD